MPKPKKPYAEFRERGDGGVSATGIPRKRRNPETGELEETGDTRTVVRAKRYVSFEAIDADGRTVQRAKYIAGQGKTKQDASRNMQRNIEKFLGLPKEERILPREQRQLTLRDYYWDEWLPANSGRYKNQEGLMSVQSRIEGHILPALGDRPRREIRRSDLRHFVDVTLPAKGLAPNTIITVQTSLSTLLNDAVEADKLPASPMAKMRSRVQATKRRIDIPDGLVDEFRAMVRGTQEETRWMLSLLLGVRPGEALGLEWDAIEGVFDDRKPFIRIQQQLRWRMTPHGPGCRRNENGKGYACGKVAKDCPAWGDRSPGAGRIVIERTTKSDKIRIIPLEEPLGSLFREQKARQEAWREGHAASWASRAADRPDLANLVFTTEDGGPRRQQDDGEILGKLLTKLAKETNGRISTSFTPHGCRHIAITGMALAGIPQHALGAIVGHVDSDTTDMYLQIQADDTRAGIAAIGAAGMNSLRSLEQRRAVEAGEMIRKAQEEERRNAERARKDWEAARANDVIGQVEPEQLDERVQEHREGGWAWLLAYAKAHSVAAYDPRVDPAPPDMAWDAAWMPQEVAEALGRRGVAPGAVELFTGDLTLDEVAKYAPMGATEPALVRRIIDENTSDALAAVMVKD
ncbi:MAG: hypothetical protein K0S70_460 [Microbacterium sp.]|jgi:integrase|nr:hypothetical protein [Microbacterium sp.]